MNDKETPLILRIEISYTKGEGMLGLLSFDNAEDTPDKWWIRFRKAWAKDEILSFGKAEGPGDQMWFIPARSVVDVKITAKGSA